MPNDPSSPSPQPLTGEGLDAIQQRTDAHGRGVYGYVINDIEYQGNWVHDIHRLLAEVDRLRAENTALAERLIDDTDTPADQAEAERFAEYFRRQEQREAEADQWAAASTQIAIVEKDLVRLAYEPVKSRARRSGRMDMFQAFQKAARSALGLDQDGKGQANG